MALAVRQIKVSTRQAGANSYGNVLASSTLAGSLIVAHSAVFNAGGSGESVLSDPTNGTYGSAASTGYFTSGDADSEIQLNAFPNSASGVTTITCNPPGTAADIDLTIFEITGAATSIPRDVSVVATDTFGLLTIDYPATTTAVTTGTLAQSQELVVFSFSHTAVSTALATDTGDSFTQADENEGNATGQTFNVGYKITAVTTSLICNGTLAQQGAGTSGTANTWFTGVASYKEAAVGTIGPLLGGHLINGGILQGRLIR